MTLSRSRRALLQRLQRRKEREREGCFVVEGVRSAAAALAVGASVRFAVMSPRLAELDADGSLTGRLERARFDLVAIDDAELAALSDTVTPQGILLVCDEPVVRLAELPAEHGMLVADAIQDPANLGTMLRSAAAFGLSALIALDGTVDPWNAKVVRGSAGASFRLPVARATSDDLLAWRLEAGVRLLAAEPGGTPVRQVDASPPWALTIGNEGAGLRPAIQEAADVTVGVPIEPGFDSLNAGMAATVLCYELSRAKRP